MALDNQETRYSFFFFTILGVERFHKEFLQKRIWVLNFHKNIDVYNLIEQDFFF